MIFQRNEYTSVRKQKPTYVFFLIYIVTFSVASVAKMEQNEPRSLAKSNLHRGHRSSVSSATSPQNQQRADQDGESQGIKNSHDFDSIKTQDMNGSSAVIESPLQSFPSNLSMASNLDIENSDADSAKHSHEHSVSFKTAARAIDFLLSPNQRLYYLCDTDCKQYPVRPICSCLPSCVYLGTCCLNFQEMCSNTTGESQQPEKDILLKHASTECIRGRYVITSCPENGESFLERSEKALPEEKAYIEHRGGPVKNETVLRRENKSYQDSRKRKPLTVLDILKIMAQNSTQVPTTLNNVMSRIISTTPILDMESGLSFRNISVFSCNGANLDRSQLWEILLSEKKGQMFPSSELATLEQILARVLYSDEHPTVRFSLDKVLSNANYMCFRDSDIIASCPDNYHDEDITSACRSTYLPVTVDGVQRGPAYKNPFCLICNEGLRYFKFRFPRFELGFPISLEFKASSPNVTVLRKLFKDNSPAWRSLTCQLQPTQSRREVDYLPRELQNGTGQCGLGYRKNVTECKFPQRERSLAENASVSELCCPIYVDEQNKSEDNFDSFSSDINWQHETNESGLEMLNHSEITGNLTEIKTRIGGQVPGIGESQSHAGQQELEAVAACSVKECTYSLEEPSGGCFLPIIAVFALPSVPLTQDDTKRHLLTFKDLLIKIFTRARATENDEVGIQPYGQRNVYIFTMTFIAEVSHLRFTSDEKEKIVNFFLNGSYPFPNDSRFVCVNIGMYRFKEVLCNPEKKLEIPETSSQDKSPDSFSCGSQAELNDLLVIVVWIAVITFVFK